MQSKTSALPVEPKKKIVIAVLFVFASMICVSGAVFSVYSGLNNISFQVMNTQISGIVFGAVILFLGVRYIMSLIKLKNEVYKPTSRFSWDNFKKTKHIKNK
jgi:hypothetical protein